MNAGRIGPRVGDEPALRPVAHLHRDVAAIGLVDVRDVGAVGEQLARGPADARGTRMQLDAGRGFPGREAARRDHDIEPRLGMGCRRDRQEHQAGTQEGAHATSLGRVAGMLLPLRSLGAALACSALIPAAAHADNVRTLDPHAQSPGHVLLNPSGSALIAWTSDPGVTDKAPIPRVCVLPRGSQCGVPVTLTLPGAGPGDLVDAGDGVEAVFPVAGPGSTVWVFGPRASHGDVLRWTSHDGGATYGTATAIAGADTNGLVDPEDALALGTTTLFGLAGSASLGVGALNAGGSAG